MKLKILTCALLGVCISSVLTSCTKYADPDPVYQDDANTDTLKKRRVLFLNIDGVSGRYLSASAPSELTSLITSHAKYSYNVYPGTVFTEAASLYTALSGVSASTHQITDSSFQYQVDASGTDIETAIESYPSLFEYLYIVKPKYKTVAVSSWSSLRNRAVQYASNVVATSDDQGVKDSLITYLQDTATNNVLYFGELNSVALASKSVDYDNSNSTVSSALSTVDGYVKEIVDAIHNRSTYNKEEWLIIINSGYGVDKTYGNEKGFTIVYNDVLSSKEVKQVGYNTPTFYANDTTKSAKLPDSSYNFGKDKDYTMSFNVKIGSPSSYPAFISKNSSLSASGGWTFFASGWGTGYEIRFYSKSGTLCRFGSNATLTDGQWHNITFTISGTGTSRVCYIYFDGVLDVTNSTSYPQPRSMSNFDLTNNVPITLGAWYRNTSSGSLSSNFNNIKIYNKALSASEVKNQAFQADLTADPNYSNLVGLWRCDDGVGTQLANSVNNDLPFVLGANTTWSQVSAPPTYSTTGESSSDYSILPQNTDIAPNIFYWLRITPENDWGWSESWLSYFESEFINL